MRNNERTLYMNTGRDNIYFINGKLIHVIEILIAVCIFAMSTAACASREGPKESIPIPTVSVFNLSATSVTLSWSTAKPATTEVEYWKSGTSEKKMISLNTLSTLHQVDIISLEPGITYYYSAKSADSERKVIAQKDGMFLLGSASVGKPAPDFTLTSLDGKVVNLNDLRGKIVVLDFWIYTCTGCKEKLRLFQEIYNKMAGKIEILCIHPKEKDLLIKSFLEADNLTTPVFIDNEGLVLKFYKITGFPTTFFIDNRGILRLIDAEFSTIEELQDIITSVTIPAQK
jgi:peroxiredoxin